MLENPCGETPAHTSGPRKDGWTDDQTIRPSKKEQKSKRAKKAKKRKKAKKSKTADQLPTKKDGQTV